MKFYKRENLSTINPMDNKLAVEVDGRIVTNTSASLQLPVGNNSQRPTVLRNGEIRYNTETGSGEIEAYINGSWQRIKTNRQQNIVQQTFTNTNYANTIFGPLTWDIDPAKPQNVMVYVDNVYQIPTTNYTLVRSTNGQPLTTSTLVSSAVSFGATLIPLDSVINFNAGQRIDGTNLSANTIVSVDTTNSTITITPGALGNISPGGLAITFFGTGTFVVFQPDSVPVPTKPVTTLLGFDGYTPPFP
jgi:hypothetical protein